MRLLLMEFHNISHSLGDRDRSMMVAPAILDVWGVRIDTSTAVPRLTGRAAVNSNAKIDGSEDASTLPFVGDPDDLEKVKASM